MLDKRTEKGRETRDSIINAAVELFSKNGFDGTSIKNITDRANVNKSLFYHYFKSKDILLEYIVDTYDLHIQNESPNNMDNKSMKNVLVDMQSKIYKKTSADKDILKIIMLEAIKNKSIFKLLIQKIDFFGKGFVPSLLYSQNDVYSEKEIAIFRFYYKFIPNIFFIITKELFSEHFDISPVELEKIFMKFFSNPPNVDKESYKNFNLESSD